MSGPFGSSPWGYNPGGSFYPYSIDQSLRFDGGSGLKKLDNTTSGNGKTFTISFWHKRSQIASGKTLFGAGAGSDATFSISFTSTDELRIGSRYVNTNGANFQIARKTTRKFRDVSSWYHIVIAIDTTVVGATSKLDYFNVWVNGEDITSDFTNVTNTEESVAATYNDPTRWNIASSNEQTVGYYEGNGTAVAYTQGYFAEVHSVDGQALNATDFGEFNNGIWVPKEVSIANYGTRGFYFDFADSSNPGNDASSGGTEDYTSLNLAASDVVPDSPTDNHATWSPIHASTSGGPVFSEGNTRFQSSGASWSYSVATMAMPNNSGKYAWKFQYNAATSGSSYPIFFITSANDSANFSTDVTPHKSNGNSLYISIGGTGSADSTIVKNVAGTDTSIVQYAHGGLNGATFEILLDTDANTITIKDKDGTARVTDYDVSYMDDGSGFIPVVQAYSYNNAELVVDYTPSDSDYKLLKSSNLPEPTISPNAAKQADDYFNTVLYTGDGNDGRTITGVGFQPDWVWVKDRNTARSHVIQDSVRGFNDGNKVLRSNDTNSESSTDNDVFGFVGSTNSDGYTLEDGTTDGRYVNNSGETYVAWNWKAGGTAVLNEDGTIDSQVSAAPDAGFSIVSWTGNGTDGATVGHGLNSRVEAVILKDRDNGTNWNVKFKDMASNQVCFLNTDDDDESPGSGYIGNFTADDTFTLVNGGSAITNVNNSGANIIAYCFHSVPGYSAVSSYVGNGSADGTFVYTGFRPAWVMIKKISGDDGWSIYDSAREPSNVMDTRLSANLSTDEVSGSNIELDFLSNGFKLRGTGSTINTTGQTYIYLAFGSSFKFANAR